jgi:hypothetical protein
MENIAISTIVGTSSHMETKYQSAENRMRSNLEGCRTFRSLVASYLDRTFRTGVKMYSVTFGTFFSTHRFVINNRKYYFGQEEEEMKLCLTFITGSSSRASTMHTTF